MAQFEINDTDDTVNTAFSCWYVVVSAWNVLDELRQSTKTKAINFWFIAFVFIKTIV